MSPAISRSGKTATINARLMNKDPLSPAGPPIRAGPGPAHAGRTAGPPLATQQTTQPAQSFALPRERLLNLAWEAGLVKDIRVPLTRCDIGTTETGGAQAWPANSMVYGRVGRVLALAGDSGPLRIWNVLDTPRFSRQDQPVLPAASIRWQRLPSVRSPTFSSK